MSVAAAVTRPVVEPHQRLFAAVLLARDLGACKTLILGYPVPRHRLMPGVLALIGEAQTGAPLTLDDDLVLRAELATPSPTDRSWRRNGR